MTTLPTLETLLKAVAYYRVSTVKQGQSGLGLEAQRSSVERFAAARGLEITAEFIEVETGTRKRRRPQMEAAIDYVRSIDGNLLIAKLDRLARNVHFVSGLMESGIRFIAVDMPEVDHLTIHVLAAVGEKEAKLISQRTKAALDVKRERDGEWRVSNLDDAARLAGAATNREQAIKDYQRTALTVKLLRGNGLSLAAVAKELNANGFKTRRGKAFRPTTVKRILDRLAV